MHEPLASIVNEPKMKFALVENIKSQASRGLKGTCINCGSEVIPKCGDVKIHHWAHKVTSNCDIWWEKETEWHRTWKNSFPTEWQEVVHYAESGEKHIADVKTASGWVIEFQHSFLKAEERNSRNLFYKKLVWVVDGLRRKSDKTQFEGAIRESSLAPIRNVHIRTIHNPHEVRLVREWMNNSAPVFYDFHDFNKSNLWLLLPFSVNGKAYLLNFPKQDFIKHLSSSGFDELVLKLIPNIKTMLTPQKNASSTRTSNGLSHGVRRRAAPRKRRF